MPDAPSSEPALLAVRRAVRRALGSTPTPRRGTEDGPRCVVVALSGGADSLALLGATVAERQSLGTRVVALVVDHGLQEGSADVAARAAAVATDLGADAAHVLPVEVGTDGGPEAAARAARYDALGRAAREAGADVVLLGHTRDDQAETVLLGMARGSGARSLSGMRAEHVRDDGTRYLRPLLDLPRTATRAACAELGVEPWEDPHNLDPSYARVRVRTELLPTLEDVLGPGAGAALARTADLLRDDADALDDWADRVWTATRAAGGPPGVDPATDASVGTAHGGGVEGRTVVVLGEDAVRSLAALPVAVRRRVLRLAALAAGVPGGSLTAEHLARLDAMVAGWTGQGAVALPGPVAASRSCGRLTFRGR